VFHVILVVFSIVGYRPNVLVVVVVV